MYFASIKKKKLLQKGFYNAITCDFKKNKNTLIRLVIMDSVK